eukprot:scaffold23.g4114.t1
MAVSHKKCGVTGMLYGAAANGSVSRGALGRDAIRTLSCRLHQQVRVCGKAVPFLHPHTTSYRYLGVWLTPSLNWQHQIRELGNALIEKVGGILRSMASPHQKLRLIDMLLKP